MWTLLIPLVALAADPPEAAPPPQFERYSLVLLKKGPKWSEQDTEANRTLMRQHLGHLTAMKEKGKMLVAGPFSDQADQNLRGMCLYATPVAEARELAAGDPRVRAGQLTVDVMTWWTEKGAVRFGD